MITEFKIYEKLWNFKVPEVGDLWKGDLTKDSCWFIVSGVKKTTDNFWVNSNNEIKCFYLDIDHASTLSSNYFSRFSRFTPNTLGGVANIVKYTQISTNKKRHLSQDGTRIVSEEIYKIEDFYKDYPDKVISIARMLNKTDIYNEETQKILNAWHNKISEIDILLTSDNYNL